MTRAAELELAHHEAHSIKGDETGLSYIGSVQTGNRIYVYYKAANGQYFYETKFQEAHGIVSEYEHVFGRKEQKGRRGGTWKNYRK